MKLRSSILTICNRWPQASLLLLTLLFSAPLNAQSTTALLDSGWEQLVRDNDTAALKLFHQAWENAVKENNTEMKARALLYSGMGSYGTSYTNGLNYCLEAMKEYKKLEPVSPAKALEGRCRCLQLMSTISSRQGKYTEAIELSREAMHGFPEKKDSTGTLGLIYNSLGNAYEHLHQNDSATFYFKLGLDETIRNGNISYLPNAYSKIAGIELAKGYRPAAIEAYNRALRIADSSANRQAQVSTLLGIGSFYVSGNDGIQAKNYFLKAIEIARGLTDQSFYQRAISLLAAQYKQEGNLAGALQLQEEMNHLDDSLNNWEKQRVVKSLEVQFNVLEKDRKIKLIQQENELSRLTNLFLLTTLFLLAIITTAIIIFLRRINKRDKQLLKTREELAHITDEQKRLKELQLRNEIEFKESQLTAMTLQMLQKNELMQELKDKYEQESGVARESGVGRIIHKAMNQEKDWSDFNKHFESMNRNFYSRLKSAYPDISPNDLKICALIKLNLSIKEMAGILNISPDSVKTARYRLRKKLELNTEDNLTDFILNL